ncbi:MAG: nucleoside hydrolase, partial [Planctomycetes bacterium]|nr:nucleoside hydrolase [Planctomycetota bacterium]
MRIHYRTSFAAFALWVFAVLFCFLDSGFCDPGEKTPILIDSDMAMDDVRALFALLAADNLEIEGLWTVEGSASLGKATDHLIGLLETNDLDHLELFMGKSASNIQPPPWRKEADTLHGFLFPPPRRIKAHENSFHAIDQLLTDHQGTIHYLALGP